jgi:hypothetical protein
MHPRLLTTPFFTVYTVGLWNSTATTDRDLIVHEVLQSCTAIVVQSIAVGRVLYSAANAGRTDFDVCPSGIGIVYSAHQCARTGSDDHPPAANASQLPQLKTGLKSMIPSPFCDLGRP